MGGLDDDESAHAGPLVKDEQRCQTKDGADGRWAGYGRALGSLRGGQASGMLRAGFGPQEP
eukprot:2331377-Alexandrium_andersonii.AAC.1